MEDPHKCPIRKPRVVALNIHSGTKAGDPGDRYLSSGLRRQSLPKYIPVPTFSLMDKYTLDSAPSKGVFMPISSGFLPVD